MIEIYYFKNSKGDQLKFYDLCHNPKCKCQKQLTYTPTQFQLERAGFQNTMKKISKGSQKALNSFLKPAVNTLVPVIGMTVG